MSLNYIFASIAYYPTEMGHLTKHFISSTGPILNLEREDGLRKKADADLASKVNLIQIQEH